MVPPECLPLNEQRTWGEGGIGGVRVGGHQIILKIETRS